MLLMRFRKKYTYDTITTIKMILKFQKNIIRKDYKFHNIDVKGNRFVS